MILLTLMLTGYLALGSPSLVTDSVINVNDYGVYGDGITQQADTLQHILDTYSRVYFPPGQYLINRSLTLRSHHWIGGRDSTVFIAVEGATTGKAFSFFTINSQENIQLEQLSFYTHDNPDRTVFAVSARNVHHLTLDQLTTHNCGVAEIRQHRDYSYEKIPTDLSSDQFRQAGNSAIKISQCRGEGSQRTMAKSTVGVLITYAYDWEITHSSFTRYQHGIQWWGGDSNTKKEGRIANVRKCQKGTISHVRITRVRGGGIWGSMGENITVENCQISYCGDVGIDFEGCFRSKATNNYVRESKNGNLVVFHHNQDILFANNQSVQSNPKLLHACIYNASQSQDNGQITFDNNVFMNTQGVGYMKQRGPSNRIIFTQNSLHNVVVDFCFNNNKYVEIKHNAFLVTRPLVRYEYIVRAGQTHYGGEVILEKNQIVTTVPQTENTYAMSLYQSDYNASPVNRVIDNTITGLAHHLQVAWAGGNAKFCTKTYVQSEQPMPPEAIKRMDTGARRSELYVNDKKWK